MPIGEHLLVPDPVTGERPVDRAVLSSVRSRRTRKALNLLATFPPITEAQRQQLLEGVRAIPLLEVTK